MATEVTIDTIMSFWRTKYNHFGASRWPLLDGLVQVEIDNDVKVGQLLCVFGHWSSIDIDSKACWFKTKQVQPVKGYQYRIMDRLGI